MTNFYQDLITGGAQFASATRIADMALLELTMRATVEAITARG